MHTYSVLLSRVDPKAGMQANFSVNVQAPTSDMAKRTAEAQYPGYKCHGSATRR